MSSKKETKNLWRFSLEFAIVVTVTATVMMAVDGLSIFPSRHGKRIPKIDRWEVLDDGTLSGIVQNHPVLEDLEEIRTSPLSNPCSRVNEGDIVTTLSGSQYRLKAPKRRRKIPIPSVFSKKLTTQPLTAQKRRPGSIPTINNWKIDSLTGRLTGVVTGHSILPDRDMISASAPIDKNLKEGMIITTESGSRYKLESPKKTSKLERLEMRMGFNAFGVAAAAGVVEILGLNSIGSSVTTSSKERNQMKEKREKKTNASKTSPVKSQFGQPSPKKIFATNITNKLKFVDDIDDLLSEVEGVLAEVDDQLKTESKVASMESVQSVRAHFDGNTKTNSEDSQKNEPLGALPSQINFENDTCTMNHDDDWKDNYIDDLDKKLQDIFESECIEQQQFERMQLLQSKEKLHRNDGEVEISQEKVRRSMLVTRLSEQHDAYQLLLEEEHNKKSFTTNSISELQCEKKSRNSLEERSKNQKFSTDFEVKNLKWESEAEIVKSMLCARLSEQHDAYQLLMQEERNKKNIIANRMYELQLEKNRRTMLGARVSEQVNAYQLLVEDENNTRDIRANKMYELQLEKNRRNFLGERLRKQKASFELGKNLKWETEAEVVRRSMLCARLSEEHNVYQLLVEIENNKRNMRANKMYELQLEKNRKNSLEERLRKQKKNFELEKNLKWETEAEVARRSMLCSRLSEQHNEYQLLVEIENIKLNELQLEKNRRNFLEERSRKQKSLFELATTLRWETETERVRRSMLCARLSEQHNAYQLLVEKENIKRNVIANNMYELQLEKNRRNFLGERSRKQKSLFELAKNLKWETEAEIVRRSMLCARLSEQHNAYQLFVEKENIKRKVNANKMYEMQLEKNRRNFLEERSINQKSLFELAKTLRWENGPETVRRSMLGARLSEQHNKNQLLLEEEQNRRNIRATKVYELQLESTRRQMLLTRLIRQLAAEYKVEAATNTSSKEAEMKVNTDRAVTVPQIESKRDDEGVSIREESARMIELERLELEFGMQPGDDNTELSTNAQLVCDLTGKEQSKASTEEVQQSIKEEGDANTELSANGQQVFNLREKEQSKASTEEVQQSIKKKGDANTELSTNDQPVFNLREKERSKESTDEVEQLIKKEDNLFSEDQKNRNLPFDNEQFEVHNKSTETRIVEQRNCDFEADEHSQKITESDLSYQPSHKILARTTLLMNEIAGISLEGYKSQKRYVKGQNVGLHAGSTLSIPVRISTPGTIVEFSISKHSYDFGYSISAILDNGQVVKIREMRSLSLSECETDKILVPIGSAPCVIQFKFQNNHSTLLEKVFLSYKIKVTPPSLSTVQLGRRRRARATLDLIESMISTHLHTLEALTGKVMELEQELGYVEKEVDRINARLESLRVKEECMKQNVP